MKFLNVKKGILPSRGAVEACVSECMIHSDGGKRGGVLPETE